MFPSRWVERFVHYGDEYLTRRDRGGKGMDERSIAGSIR
jgi:hypothetical protein